MKSISISRDIYNEKILKTLSRKEFIHILYGGSSSGKSYGVAQYYLEAILDLDRNVLALRKVARTVKHSIFALFQQLINKHNLEDLYTINKSEYSIKSKYTGYKIVCGGLDDPEKIKSITFEKGNITDIWLEEATEFTEKDYMQLKLRLRGKSKKTKRIRMTFNPISNMHWIKKRFFDQVDENVYIEKFTYHDNDFLEEEDISRIESLKNEDPVYYEVYAKGNWGVLGNLVFNNWRVEDLSSIKDTFNSYDNGIDFGFTNHPTAIVKIGYKNDTIYILDEHYEKGMENYHIAKAYKNMCTGYVYCDSAEPKSIKELRNYKVQSLSVKKGKDSVRHGIQWIRQRKIIIDKRCINFINEIQTYKYKEDKDGNVLQVPVDMNNHLMDAMRYALEYRMIAYKKSGLAMGDFGL
jgi:phage terminase large subunit